MATVNYKKVSFRAINGSQNYSTFTNPFSLYAILREDTANKKVYAIMFQNFTQYSFTACPLNQEILLYDFNLQFGDSLKVQDLCLLLNDDTVYSLTFNTWISTAKAYTINNNSGVLYEGVGSNYGLFETIGVTIGPSPYNLFDYCRGSLSNCNLITTGVEYSNLINTIKIVPNPVVNYFSVNSAEDTDFEYKIFTFEGQIVKKGMSLTNVNIHVKLDRGIYFLQIDNTKTHLVKKIIKLN